MNQKPSNGAGVASLVLGIIGTVFGFFGMFAIVGLVLGIVACVMSAMSKKNVGPNGMATAGLVLGILAIVFCGIMFVACAAWGGAAACASCAAAM